MMWGYRISGARREGNELVVNVRASRLRSLVVVAQAVREAARGRSLRDRALLFAALALFVGKVALRGLAVIAGTVAVLVLPALALTGCPMPSPDGCSPGSRRCHEDTPQVCSPGQRWTPADVTCSTVRATCVVRDGVPACLRGEQ